MEQVVADDEGQYRFSHLPPGRYFVVVTAQPWYAQSPIHERMVVRFNEQGEQSFVEKETVGDSQKARSPLDVTYPTTYYAAATDSSQATPIILNPGDRANTDVTLAPVPALHVRIKTPNEQAGMSVQVFRKVFGQEMPLPVGSQSTNGYTEVAGLASGEVILDIQQFGKVANEKQTSRVMAVDLANDLEIDPAQASRSATISGHVTIEGATALPSRTFIHLHSLSSGEEMGSRVTPQGDFQFQAPYIQPGRYVVSTVNNGEAVLKTVAATGAQVSGRILELTGSGPVQLKVSLSPGVGQVKGTAMRGSKPQAGVMVVLVPRKPEENPTIFRRDQSDSDGTFTLDTVVPGTYTLIAIENGWDLEWRNPTVLNPYLRNAQVVEVRAGGKYDFKVEVQ